MTLWLALILMTMVALAAVVWPFLVARASTPSGSDVAVYKDQLVEIERDREAGLIAVADAEAARIEVSRRLLNAAETADSFRQPSLTGDTSRTRRLAVVAAVLVFLPALAAGMYLRLGAPGLATVESMPDQSARSSDETLIDTMVAQVEGYLRETPNDGHGWEVLAPVYMRLGRYEDSARAWRNAIADLGDSADREENLGESLVAAANGIVIAEARTAFDRALSVDRNRVTARYYIGLAAKQDGRHDEAARIWRDLVAAAPPDAGWIDTVRNALARLDEAAGATADSASSSEVQQKAMIRSMVEGLAARLKADGGDVDGWLRLVRSYNVLGEHEKADAASADGRRALADDPDKLAHFENGLTNLDRPTESSSRATAAPSTPTVTAAPEHDAPTVQAMVANLAERLRTKGGGPDSWLMLVRSYETFGEREKAATAIAQARSAFAYDPDKLAQFNQLLSSVDSVSSVPVAPNASQRRDVRESARADTAPTEEQAAMINSMVDRLAERLKANGNDVDGWIQLMRSYVVLGRRDQASAAGRSARIALGDNNDALRRLSEGARELDVELP